jgi:ComF family protein
MISSNKLNPYANSLFDFFLPRFCPACKQKLSSDENTACKECMGKIRLVSTERLTKEFGRKFANNNIISDFFSAFIFEKDKELQHIIHALKYDKKFLVGNFLGQQLGKYLLIKKDLWQIDLIVPIPLHQLKKAERGFNQSSYIAKGIGKILHVTSSDRVVKRIKYTESQTTMTLNERAENISGAFRIRNKNGIKGKNILLIDDVITTGATISECGKILLEAGANKIYAASVAVAD